MIPISELPRIQPDITYRQTRDSIQRSNITSFMRLEWDSATSQWCPLHLNDFLMRMKPIFINGKRLL